MTVAYHNTDVLLDSLKTAKKATSFLTKRYFPEGATAEFITKDVLIEFKNGNKKAAPFVVPHIGGVAVTRKGYTSKRFEPANIEVFKTLRVDELQEKGFGEALYSKDAPEVREQKLLAEDLLELDEMAIRRQEVMAAEVLSSSKIVMSYKTGENGKDETREIRYYEEQANPYAFSVETEWDEVGATIIDDLFSMCQLMSTKGVKPEDLLVTPKVMSAFRKNTELMKLLDTKNYAIGNIAPEDIGDGAALLGKLNVDGYLLNLISYNEHYENESGVSVPFLADGTIILTAPAVGQTVYGAVTQKEESDKQTHTYQGRRVPKVTTDVEGDKSKVKLTTKPLLAPKKIGGWISAVVITDSST